MELKNLRPDGTIGEPEDEAAEDAADVAAEDEPAEATEEETADKA